MRRIGFGISFWRTRCGDREDFFDGINGILDGIYGIFGRGKVRLSDGVALKIAFQLLERGESQAVALCATAPAQELRRLPSDDFVGDLL
jgi:hypothetical protein